MKERSTGTNLVERDVDLDEFAPPTTLNGVEVRLSMNGRCALVKWPWHLDYTDRVAPVMETVRQMGYRFIIETGAVFSPDAHGHIVDHEYYLVSA